MWSWSTGETVWVKVGRWAEVVRSWWWMCSPRAEPLCKAVAKKVGWCSRLKEEGEATRTAVPGDDVGMRCSMGGAVTLEAGRRLLVLLELTWPGS